MFVNAIAFTNCSVEHINRGVNINQNRVIAITTLQMALELSIKAVLIKEKGVYSIFTNIDIHTSESEIEQRYSENRLKTKEFENLKNLMKSDQSLSKRFGFDGSRYKHMERFQIYRNKLVHLNFVFSKKEQSQIEKDLLSVLVNIIGALLSDDKVINEERTFMQEYLEEKEYKKLLRNEMYIEALNEYIKQEYGKSYFCPICDKMLFIPIKKCLGCFKDFTFKKSFGFIKCKFCGENTVIYDRNNLDINGNEARGLCLNCQEDTIVYECHICGGIVDLEFLDSSDCKKGFCSSEQ